MKIDPKKLKKFLTSLGIVSESEFKRIEQKAEKEKKPVEDVLVDEKIIKRENMLTLEAHILGIPFVNLEKEKVPDEVLKIIPEPIARSHNIVAFRKSGKNLEVAMLDPQDLKTIEFIKKKSDYKILPRLTTEEGIKNVLRQYQKTLKAEFGEIIEKEGAGGTEIQTIQEEEEKEIHEKGEDLSKAAKELPIIRIVDTLMKHAILEKASDIHIEPVEKELVVRYRIDGILRDAMILPISVAPAIIARIKVLSNLKLDEHRLPQDGRFKIETEDFKYSVRVSVLPVFGGEKIVLRLLPETVKAPTLEELGLRGEALEAVQHSLTKPVGMILVTGPTGSGKTTTLYTMLGILNTPEVNISTIEDPIEYRMPRINQTQVDTKIGLTFANGLRSLLRQDPDIVMVGEIRDNETASLAINAALTGHLVLSTLHTNNASGAIPRLIDMKVEPFLISSTLEVIMAQRLVRVLCATKEEYKLKEVEIKNLAKYCDLERVLEILKEEKIIGKNDTFKDVKFFRPKPSAESPDGYSGRIGIFEVLDISPIIKELIIKRATSDEIQAQAKKEGMRTMIEDGLVKAAQGITTIEEVLRVIIE
jgi:type IV pilus assembly protein PilB